MNGDQTLTEFPRTQIPEDAFVLPKPANRTNPTTLHCQLYLHEQKTNHNMEVETGRYQSPKTPISSRTCQLCNDGSIVDEVHFLNSCRPLHKLRTKLFQAASRMYDHKEAFYTLPHEQKTILLMQLCSVNPAIAKIIYVMFLVRKSLIHC